MIFLAGSQHHRYYFYIIVEHKLYSAHMNTKTVISMEDKSQFSDEIYARSPAVL